MKGEKKSKKQNKPTLIEMCLTNKLVLKQYGVSSVSHYIAVTSNMKYICNLILCKHKPTWRAECSIKVKRQGENSYLQWNLA